MRECRFRWSCRTIARFGKAACRKHAAVGVLDRRNTLKGFEFLASLLCVTGAALSSFWLEGRGRRRTLELFVQISWQVQYFGAWRADCVARAEFEPKAKKEGVLGECV